MYVSKNVTTGKIDKEKVEEAIRMLLEAIGENPDREGLKATPSRIARMYEEIYTGSDEMAYDHLSRTFTCENSDMVIEKDITFYSTCEHHMMPFYGKAHIAYIPDGKVVGISKLARTVEEFAKRLQMQLWIILILKELWLCLKLSICA